MCFLRRPNPPCVVRDLNALDSTRLNNCLTVLLYKVEGDAMGRLKSERARNLTQTSFRLVSPGHVRVLKVRRGERRRPPLSDGCGMCLEGRGGAPLSRTDVECV
jgi:hypothetical protein